MTILLFCHQWWPHLNMHVDLCWNGNMVMLLINIIHVSLIWVNVINLASYVSSSADSVVLTWLKEKSRGTDRLNDSNTWLRSLDSLVKTRSTEPVIWEFQHRLYWFKKAHIVICETELFESVNSQFPGLIRSRITNHLIQIIKRSQDFGSIYLSIHLSVYPSWLKDKNT